jgi:starvation-inducible DNA-binding protein
MSTITFEALQVELAAQAANQSGSRPKTKAVLNQTVADLSKAASIIHQIHWYMRGRGFLRLHPAMDELMDGLNGHLDEFSERLIMLGGAPYSTLKEFDEASFLQETKGSFDLTVEDHLNRLLEVYSYLRQLYQLGLDVTDEEGDDPSNGLFADAQGEVEKNIWMLQAELGQAPGLE